LKFIVYRGRVGNSMEAHDFTYSLFISSTYVHSIKVVYYYSTSFNSCCVSVHTNITISFRLLLSLIILRWIGGEINRNEIAIILLVIHAAVNWFWLRFTFPTSLCITSKLFRMTFLPRQNSTGTLHCSFNFYRVNTCQQCIVQVSLSL
jgi:hypothetical protein